MSSAKSCRPVFASLTLCLVLLASTVVSQPIDMAYAETLLKGKVNVSSLVTFPMAEKLMKRIETNLEFYEKTKWGMDLRAAYQLFMVQLHLQAAVNSTQMSLYNKMSPVQTGRLQKIVLRSQKLASFVRYRILARVPRKNLTRQVSALFVFTPTPWSIFLPPLPSEAERLNWTQYLNRTLQRKLNQTDAPVFPSDQDFVRDLVGDTKEAELAYNVSMTCLRTVTMNPINDSVLFELVRQQQAMLNPNATANATRSPTNETLDMKRCRVPKELRERCYNFARQGKPFLTNRFGHANFYRILLLTTARLARNCYFVSPATDLKIIHYLCFLASVQIDKMKGMSPAAINPGFYKDLDSLTKHDFANICLLNGLPQFLLQDLMDCDNGELVWYDIGCYGPKGAGTPVTPKPLPWWIIMRPNMHENKVCNRHQTAACFAYHAASLRALVELGDLKPPPSTTPTTPGPTTEFFPD